MNKFLKEKHAGERFSKSELRNHFEYSKNRYFNRRLESMLEKGDLEREFNKEKGRTEYYIPGGENG